jgi:hypothetical protein
VSRKIVVRDTINWGLGYRTAVSSTLCGIKSALPMSHVGKDRFLTGNPMEDLLNASGPLGESIERIMMIVQDYLTYLPLCSFSPLSVHFTSLLSCRVSSK